MVFYKVQTRWCFCPFGTLISEIFGQFNRCPLWTRIYVNFQWCVCLFHLKRRHTVGWFSWTFTNISSRHCCGLIYNRKYLSEFSKSVWFDHKLITTKMFWTKISPYAFACTHETLNTCGYRKLVLVANNNSTARKYEQYIRKDKLHNVNLTASFILTSFEIGELFVRQGKHFWHDVFGKYSPAQLN